MDTLRGGVYNCASIPSRVHRRVKPRTRVGVARWVGRTMTRRGLDFMVLSEAGPYLTELRRLVGVTVVACDEWTDAADSVILARDGLRVRGERWFRMTRRWYGFKNNRWRAPRTLTKARISWLPVLAVHLPPGAETRRNNPAYAEAAMRVAAWLEGRKRGVAVGDFNATIRQSMTYGPAWIADESGARPAPGAWGIDLALGIGVTLHDWTRRRDNGGSDHPFYTFAATRD